MRPNNTCRIRSMIIQKVYASCSLNKNMRVTTCYQHTPSKPSRRTTNPASNASPIQLHRIIDQRPGAGRSGRQLQQAVASAASEDIFEISPLDSLGISQDLSGRFRSGGKQPCNGHPVVDLLYILWTCTSGLLCHASLIST
mgnify:CR=1 FL=1